MCTTYIIFFKNDSEEEKIPAFLVKRNCEITGDKLAICCFKSFSAIRGKTWNDLKNEIQKSSIISYSSFVVFAHNLSQCQTILDDLLRESLPHVYIDYSSGDPSYKPMWEQIRNSKDVNELVKILEYWKHSYVVDPLRRIKHRAINLYMPLSTDIQFLLEIWRRKDFSKAKTYLEELKAEWSESKSPISILNRLWYMLVGKHLNWGEGDLPKMPTDVSLPMGKSPDRKEEPLSLYDWLAKYFGEKQVQGLEPWQKLLAHSQIDSPNEKTFNVKSEAGVYLFSTMITEMIEYPENIKPNNFVNGLKLNETYQEQFNDFLDWLNNLNDNFESLITQCQKKS